MNFSKKNHEHKVVNLKMVSKKIILSVVFVFASLSMVNANSNVENFKNLKLSQIAESDRFCEEQALAVGESSHIAGMSDEQIFFNMNVAYALCEGYTYQEIVEAGNMG
ncbi:hypothetical protein [Lutibacter sp.]|uniref:hypothetical protein n=1 Tax=Lutibacter sp. TaxID=1925666 RepID=UPI001A2E025C|nr:hypothetical protein [Lutibacter sp.]MBI9041872.1 hypothetical protein [Lutibacter sp.]